MGHFPGFYYQIVEGKVKMNNFTEDGKEFIQNIFVKRQRFGELLLFIDEPYPANAIAVTKGKVLEIPKILFYEMLHQHPEVFFELNKSLACKLYYKSIMAPEISLQSPEKRIWTLLTYLKKREGEKGRISGRFNRIARGNRDPNHQTIREKRET